MPCRANPNRAAAAVFTGSTSLLLLAFGMLMSTPSPDLSNIALLLSLLFGAVSFWQYLTVRRR